MSSPESLDFDFGVRISGSSSDTLSVADAKMPINEDKAPAAVRTPRNQKLQLRRGDHTPGSLCSLVQLHVGMLRNLCRAGLMAALRP